ncbi:hypothetical protein BDN70DRAFT_377658 [Pholiota conissans]|uniref:Uncharacterized protein n=1 Tax=Pholiota conissans TaxID=109636 RepID=A0A9P5YT89_9AGAR|nr:hypothetical protein BDN70DRAFT_377658 [Pholiota conissans]
MRYVNEYILARRLLINVTVAASTLACLTSITIIRRSNIPRRLLLHDSVNDLNNDKSSSIRSSMQILTTIPTHGGVHLQRLFSNKVHFPTTSDAYDMAITTASRGFGGVVVTATMQAMGASRGDGAGSSRIYVMSDLGRDCRICKITITRAEFKAAMWIIQTSGRPGGFCGSVIEP